MTDGAIFSASALSVVLAVSGLSKLRAPDAFRRALGTYRVLPSRSVPLLMVAVPTAELTLGALQWLPALRPAVSFGLIALFSAFTLLLLRSLIANEDADCGCFGSPVRQRVSWFSIVRNVVLIGLAMMLLVAGDGAGRGELPAALAGIGAGLLILVLDQATTLLARDGFTARRG